MVGIPHFQLPVKIRDQVPRACFTDAKQSEWQGSLIGWLLKRPSTMLVSFRDGSAQTVARAAILRQELHIQFAILHGHRILTPDQPVARDVILRQELHIQFAILHGHRILTPD